MSPKAQAADHGRASCVLRRIATQRRNSAAAAARTHVPAGPEPRRGESAVDPERAPRPAVAAPANGGRVGPARAWWRPQRPPRARLRPVPPYMRRSRPAASVRDVTPTAPSDHSSRPRFVASAERSRAGPPDAKAVRRTHLPRRDSPRAGPCQASRAGRPGPALGPQARDLALKAGYVEFPQGHAARASSSRHPAARALPTDAQPPCGATSQVALDRVVIRGRRAPAGDAVGINASQQRGDDARVGSARRPRACTRRLSSRRRAAGTPPTSGTAPRRGSPPPAMRPARSAPRPRPPAAARPTARDRDSRRRG